MRTFFDELLELAGCDIQLNETVSDIKLHNAPSMSVSEFRKVISYDPVLFQYLDLSDTELGQKPNSYLQWLIRHWDNIKQNSAEDVRNLLNSFTVCKNRHKLENGDINSYNSISEILDAVKIANDQEDSLTRKQKDARKASRSADSDILLLCSGDIYDMYYPKTYAASVRLGKDTHWCTATNSDDESYKKYSALGPLFIFINKKNPNEKYQLWYSESGENINDYDGNHTLHDENNNPKVNFLYDILIDKKIYDFLHNNPKITPYLEKYWSSIMKESFDLIKNKNINSLKYYLDINDIDYVVKKDGSITVKDFLDLSKTKISILPDKLEVRDSLYLNNYITTLPKDLKVGGDLDLRFLKIVTMPNKLEVNGDLDLSRTAITTLPKDLKVGGDLYLSYTEITDLPNNLQVYGNLDLRHSKVTGLPLDYIIHGEIYR